MSGVRLGYLVGDNQVRDHHPLDANWPLVHYPTPVKSVGWPFPSTGPSTSLIHDTSQSSPNPLDLQVASAPDHLHASDYYLAMMACWRVKEITVTGNVHTAYGGPHPNSFNVSWTARFQRQMAPPLPVPDVGTPAEIYQNRIYWKQTNIDFNGVVMFEYRRYNSVTSLWETIPTNLLTEPFLIVGEGQNIIRWNLIDMVQTGAMMNDGGFGAPPNRSSIVFPGNPNGADDYLIWRTKGGINELVFQYDNNPSAHNPNLHNPVGFNFFWSVADPGPAQNFNICVFNQADGGGSPSNALFPMSYEIGPDYSLIAPGWNGWVGFCEGLPTFILDSSGTVDVKATKFFEYQNSIGQKVYDADSGAQITSPFS